MTAGVSATYIVYYFSIKEHGNETEAKMSITTRFYSVMIENLGPAAYYQLTVMADLNQIQIPSNVGIGV